MTTLVLRARYRVDLTLDVNDTWKPELNSNDRHYGNSDFGAIEESQVHQVLPPGHSFSLELTTSPIICLFYNAQALIKPTQDQEQMSKGNGYENLNLVING